MSDILKHL